MNDSSGCRGSETIGMHMGHDIVPTALFLDGGRFEFVVLDEHMRLELGDGFFRNGQTQLALGLGQVDPKLSPGREAVAGGEDVFHLLTTVSRVERAERCQR